ncbi:hypothetical protein [Streptomyces sp. NBC_01304]|uniref:hypothetical protein n=1 Tax=Streptomyces sp. NBC_01304 TaxID=2903818 RepID=UPI002E0FA963|nr:hypothetical protein OG430_44240 [Streptomyces sp. NBC_01304]
MTALLPYLIVVGCLALVMGFFSWLAVLVRRRGSAGAGIRAAFASHDEAFYGTAHAAHYEIQAQAERKAPLLSPDDDWRRRRPTEDARAAAHSRRTPSRRSRRGVARWAARLRRAGR